MQLFYIYKNDYIAALDQNAFLNRRFKSAAI